MFLHYSKYVSTTLYDVIPFCEWLVLFLTLIHQVDKAVTNESSCIYNHSLKVKVDWTPCDQDLCPPVQLWLSQFAFCSPFLYFNYNKDYIRVPACIQVISHLDWILSALFYNWGTIVPLDSCLECLKCSLMFAFFFSLFVWATSKFEATSGAGISYCFSF